jgi:flagellar basal-body rod modification protein FlgD
MTSPLGYLPGTLTTPIDGASATGASSATQQPAGKELDKDAFLKLLVAQLRYQDPSSPADGTAFLAQTAQFTQVERLDDVSKAMQQMLSAQLMLGASNLVGKTVSYTGSDGRSATGVVASATFSGSSPTLRVGNTDVPLSSVTEVRSTTG